MITAIQAREAGLNKALLLQLNNDIFAAAVYGERNIVFNDTNVTDDLVDYLKEIGYKVKWIPGKKSIDISW